MGVAADSFPAFCSRDNLGRPDRSPAAVASEPAAYHIGDIGARPYRLPERTLDAIGPDGENRQFRTFSPKCFSISECAILVDALRAKERSFYA
jgi:hypothetical protein